MKKSNSTVNVEKLQPNCHAQSDKPNSGICNFTLLAAAADGTDTLN
jgi:hypothetical protein